MGILRSVRKSLRLRKLSKALGYWADGQPNIQELTADMIQDLQAGGKKLSASDRALSELLELCEQDPACAEVIALYQGNREALRDLYKLLLNAGGGTWVAGHFVAASSLAFAQPLHFLLEKRQKGELEGRYNSQAVAWRLVKYFAEGETGPVI